MKITEWLSIKGFYDFTNLDTDGFHVIKTCKFCVDGKEMAAGYCPKIKGHVRAPLDEFGCTFFKEKANGTS